MQGRGTIALALFYAPALLILQDIAYSYRVWITLIKLSYTPLRGCLSDPDFHQGERLCGRLLPSVLRVSEKNSSRKLAESNAPPPYAPVPYTYASVCKRVSENRASETV